MILYLFELESAIDSIQRLFAARISSGFRKRLLLVASVSCLLYTKAQDIPLRINH